MTLAQLTPLTTRGPCRRALSSCLALAAASLALAAWLPAGPALAQEADEAPAVGAPPSDPDWFNKLLARTAEPLPAIEVASEDGFFRASVPAKLLQPVEALDGFYLLTLDYGPGADSSAECYVYDDALDIAGSLLLVSESVFELAAEVNGPIEAKAIYGIEAGAIGATPYMGLAWLYRAAGTDATGGAVAGQAKHWMAVKQGRGLYCQSTAIGYDDALFGLFRSLVSTLEYAQPLVDDLYYTELGVIKIGDTMVGVAQSEHRIDQDGDVEIRETSAMLLPVDSETLTANDSVRVDYSNLAGDLVARVEVDGEDGETVTHMNLARNEAGEWIASGFFRGKDLETNLGEADLRGVFGQRLDLRRFVETAEVDSAIILTGWSSELDPTRLIDSKSTFLGRAENGTLWRVEAESMQFDAVFDEVMGLRSVVMPIGGTELTIEQIYTEGDAFAPLQLELEPADEPPGPGE